MSRQNACSFCYLFSALALRARPSHIAIGSQPWIAQALEQNTGIVMSLDSCTSYSYCDMTNSLPHPWHNRVISFDIIPKPSVCIRKYCICCIMKHCVTKYDLCFWLGLVKWPSVYSLPGSNKVCDSPSPNVLIARGGLEPSTPRV